jgi:glycosyltransferase involved in cell wall biosynthesis
MTIGFATRRDWLSHRGGDTIQMEKTMAALTSLGLRTIVCGEARYQASIDILHVINLQGVVEANKHIQRGIDYGVPIVLSPIIWDTSYLNTSNIQRLARSIARSSRIPIWLSFLNLSKDFRSSRKRWMLARNSLSQVDLILPNSIAELEGIVSLYGIPDIRAKSEVVYNGVDLDWYEKNISHLKPVDQRGGVVCVGRIESAKGQLELIRAFRSTKLPRLTIVGRCNGMGYYNLCLKEADFDKRITFLNEVDQSQLKEIYSNHRVHCLLSVRESPGLVSLEAYARGCALVVTPHCPVQEYFGNNVKVVNRQYTDQVACALTESHENYFKILNQRDYDCKRQKFNWESIGKCTLKCYEQVIQQLR